MDNSQNISINLNFKPSKTFSRKLIIAVLDYLMHYRSQIPFTFEIFEKFIKNRQNSELVKCYKISKQISVAKETYDKICAIKEIIETEVEATKSFLIIFGSTIHTAKEAFKISIPTITDHVLPTYINETTTLTKILLQLVQCENLKLSNTLCSTNTFILFNRKTPATESSDLYELRNFKLNRSCKKFLINFCDTSEFEIFQEDFEELKLSDDNAAKDKTDFNEIWYQSKIFVKGFNDILVNNKSIWN